MVTSVLAVTASSWGVLMGISPVLQIRQMLRERSSREVSLGYYVILLAGFLLWISYGIAARNLVLIIPNTVALLVGLTLIAVALRLRRPLPAGAGPSGRRACYPARAGGPWLCRTLVLSLFHAVVVPSGLTARVQPSRWIITWWWYGHSKTQSLRLVLPPLALWVVWWTWQAPAGWPQPPAHSQCPRWRTRGRYSCRVTSLPGSRAIGQIPDS